MTQTMSILLALKRWIRVQVPKIEDGNNFGVSVQLDVAKVRWEALIMPTSTDAYIIAAK